MAQYINTDSSVQNPGTDLVYTELGIQLGSTHILQKAEF